MIIKTVYKAIKPYQKFTRSPSRLIVINNTTLLNFYLRQWKTKEKTSKERDHDLRLALINSYALNTFKTGNGRISLVLSNKTVVLVAREEREHNDTVIQKKQANLFFFSGTQRYTNINNKLNMLKLLQSKYLQDLSKLFTKAFNRVSESHFFKRLVSFTRLQNSICTLVGYFSKSPPSTGVFLYNYRRTSPRKLLC